MHDSRPHDHGLRMTPTPDELAAVPEILRKLYQSNPDKYGSAIIDTARQLRGEKPLPSLARQAANFVVAAAEHVGSGLSEVAPEVAEQRLALCQPCENYRTSDNRCSLCGCGVSLKATWVSSRCPMGKW